MTGSDLREAKLIGFEIQHLDVSHVLLTLPAPWAQLLISWELRQFRSAMEEIWVAG